VLGVTAAKAVHRSLIAKDLPCQAQHLGSMNSAELSYVEIGSGYSSSEFDAHAGEY
jgi:hypothetical protein